MSDAEYRILFMVRRPYYDAIVAGTKTFELRRRTSRWYAMAWKASMAIKDGGFATAVLMSGRRVHRRCIVGLTLVENARFALGRVPTPEELEFLGDGEVIRFVLGGVVP